MNIVMLNINIIIYCVLSCQKKVFQLEKYSLLYAQIATENQNMLSLYCVCMFEGVCTSVSVVLEF